MKIELDVTVTKNILTLHEGLGHTEYKGETFHLSRSGGVLFLYKSGDNELTRYSVQLQQLGEQLIKLWETESADFS